MVGSEPVDLALFEAGIVLGAFSGPILWSIRSIFEGEERTGARSAVLAIVVTVIFFVGAFWALLDDAIGVLGFWMWVPAIVLLIGVVALIPVLVVSTGVEVSLRFRGRPPKTTT